MMRTRKITIILDANIWFSQRMLQSALGSTVLRIFAEEGFKIALPEVIEKEVNAVISRSVRAALDTIQRETRLLRSLTLWDHQLLLPSALASADYIEQRWAALSGILLRIPMTLQHASEALDKIINKLPPCGENNEQFRDAAIWSAAIGVAAPHVILVTNDRAFYKDKVPTNGLASNLLEEAAAAHRKVEVFPDLDAMMKALRLGGEPLEDVAITAAVAELVAPKARDIARMHEVTLDRDRVDGVKIVGYGAPGDGLLAVSFRAQCTLITPSTAGETNKPAKLVFKGSMNWDTARQTAADFQLSEWDLSLRNAGHSWKNSGFDEYKEGNFITL